MRDLPGNYRKAFEYVLPFLEIPDPPVPLQLGGPDRKVWRRDGALEYLSWVSLSGHEYSYVGAGSVTG
jgi:hypothetical protein